MRNLSALLLLTALLAASILSPRSLAAGENSCDLNGIAQRRSEAAAHIEDAKRGIAGMPYSEKKLQAAEKEILAHEPMAAETIFRNVPEELGSELKRLEALASRPSTSRVPPAFTDGAFTGEKKAGANLAVLAGKFDPPSAGQREAVENLLSQTNPRIDEVIVGVDRHGGALYADRLKMAQLALPKDPRIKFADLNKISGESHAEFISKVAAKNAAHTVTAIVPGDEVLSKDFTFVKNANARYAVVTGKDDSEMIMGVAALKAGERKSMVSSFATEAGGLSAKSKPATLDPAVTRYAHEHELYGTEQVIKIGPDEVGLIGYGSLINRDSIERTLGRKLPADALREVKVSGWKRTWDVFMPNEAFYEKTADGGRQYPAKIAYLNFQPDPNCKSNCSLFVINKKDLAGFDTREWIYERRDFTDQLDGVKLEGGSAYAYVGRKQFLYDTANPGEVRMRSSYFDIVEKALEQKSPEYRKDYWAGTDPLQPLRITDVNDLTKRQMDQPVGVFGPPTPPELAAPVKAAKIFRGVPVFAASDRAALKFQKPALAAAVDYQEAGARDLAAVRRRYWSGQASFKELEAAQAKFGPLETPVTGTSQASRRIGYLRQEQSFVARDLARAEADGDAAKAAILNSQLAAVGAQALGETDKRANLIAASPAAAKAARREALSSFEQTFQRNEGSFSGLTYQRAIQDPKQAALLSAIMARDAEADGAAAREARRALESVVKEKLPSNLGPEKLAQDIVNLHANTRDPSSLLKQGWNRELVDKCVGEGICAPRLEALDGPRSELYTRAKAVMADRELASALGEAADEASRVVPEIPFTKAGELRDNRAALDSEAANFAKLAEAEPLKFKPLEAEARAAASAVSDKIDTPAAGDLAPKSARPLAKAEAQLGDYAAAETKKLEAEARVLAQKVGRSLASVEAETPATLKARATSELALVGGLMPAQRSELVKGIGALAAQNLDTARGALRHFTALVGNPDMLETYRLSFAEASKELGKSKDWNQAWEAGVKRMLSESGYSKEEIMKVVDEESGVRFYQQTARCLKI
jgi:hypothetical protein